MKGVRPSKITNVPPTFNDHFIKDGYVWLETKRADDNVEDGLWRIHNDIYDLTDFAKRHPGGADWITMTKGLDITELVESHHIYYDKLTPYLKKYHVRATTRPRNSKFTFEPNGFYVTMRKKVADKLPHLVKTTPKLFSKIYIDFLFILTLVAAIVSLRTHNYVIGFIAALLYTWTGVGGHNFLHQKINYRANYLGLLFLSHRDWRITHVFSHHMFPNSLLDVETMLFEPLFVWTPDAKHKNVFQRFGPWLYGWPIFFFVYTLEFGKKLIKSILGKNTMHLDDFWPLIVPVLMYAFGANPLVFTLKWYISMLGVSSFIFALIALCVGHHHPESVHDGDAVRESYDFGVYNLDTVVDRSDIRGNTMMTLTNFGDHAMHHLFPTLDHGILPQLYDVFFETIKEFEIEFQGYPWLETIRGQFAELSRNEFNKKDSLQQYREKYSIPKNVEAKEAKSNADKSKELETQLDKSAKGVDRGSA